MKEGKNSFPKLVHINDVKPINEADKPLMDELYQVLKRYGALDKYAVTLLHEHFPIDDDEVLIESTNKDLREQTLEIIDREKVDTENLIPSSWRFDVKNEQ